YKLIKIHFSNDRRGRNRQQRPCFLPNTERHIARNSHPDLAHKINRSVQFLAAANETHSQSPVSWQRCRGRPTNIDARLDAAVAMSIAPIASASFDAALA